MYRGHSYRRTRPGRKRPGRFYSLDKLLGRQPRSLRKIPAYRDLLAHFLSSENLQRLRISSRCFRLLDQALIKPENLNSFYKTYRLPRDSFFPVFLMIKRSYLQERTRWKEERDRYIWEGMKSLPPNTVRFIRFLAEWEQNLNPGSDFPFWMKYLLPGTKKRLHEYERFDTLKWISFFYTYLTGLAVHYHLKPHPLAEKLAACFTLELVPQMDPIIFPERRSIMKSYRTLCRSFHPDRGGDPALFLRLQEAKEALCPV